MGRGQDAGLSQPAGTWHRVRVIDRWPGGFLGGQIYAGPGAWLSINSSELRAGEGATTPWSYASSLQAVWGST